MLGLFTQIAEIKQLVPSTSTDPYTVTFTTVESTVPCRMVPLRGKNLMTALGGLPKEMSELYLDTRASVLPGYRAVVDSVTYQVLTVEAHGPDESFVRCLIERVEN